MKLRIHRNSIRLRLTPDDVRTLRETGEVGGGIDFGGDGVFTYRLRKAAGEGPTHARLLSNDIVVEVPGQLLEAWAASDQVGIEQTQTASDGAAVRILIEKDFECLDGDAVADEVYFPNPNPKCG